MERKVLVRLSLCASFIVPVLFGSELMESNSEIPQCVIARMDRGWEWVVPTERRLEKISFREENLPRERARHFIRRHFFYKISEHLSTLDKERRRILVLNLIDEFMALLREASHLLSQMSDVELEERIAVALRCLLLYDENYDVPYVGMVRWISIEFLRGALEEIPNLVRNYSHRFNFNSKLPDEDFQEIREKIVELTIAVAASFEQLRLFYLHGNDFSEKIGEVLTEEGKTKDLTRASGTRAMLFGLKDRVISLTQSVLLALERGNVIEENSKDEVEVPCGRVEMCLVM